MIIIVFISQYLLCIETSENMFQSFKVDLPNYKTQINFHKDMNQSNESQLNFKRIHMISSNTTDQYHLREERKLHNNKSVESHGDYYHSSLSSTSITTPLNKVIKTINFITFKISDCYLHSPSMHLYEKFRLQFTFRTSQEHGLILFNSDKYGVDFLAFELIKGYLHFVFDMGSGSQRFALTTHSVTDSNWHNVELFREDLENNILQLYIDRNQSIEQFLKIPVFNGDIARNFNLNDPLYIGGISQLVFLKWREKLSSYHGFQGCLGNFSINGLPPFDLLNMAKLKYAKNWTLPVCRDQIVDNCHHRPKGVLNCNQIQNHSTNTKTNKNVNGDNDKDKLFQPYCLNDGICLQTWLGVKCACELTTFDGHRCMKAGTTFVYGIHDDSIINNNNNNNLSNKFNHTISNHDNIGYLRFIYKDYEKHTRQDEFILGIQTFYINFTHKKQQKQQHRNYSQTYNDDNYISTLLFVTSLTQIGDFIHLFLESGIVRLNYNMGGGVVHISGPNFPINDGFYHRIRGYRVDRQIILEVDDSRHTYELNSIYGKQFNNQKVIWLGHAPRLNKTDFFHGYMTGVYYNGLLLNDIAAGLSYLMHIHVTRFGNVKHITKFQPKLLKSDYYKDGVNYVNRDEPVSEETTNRILSNSIPLFFYSNSSPSSLTSNYKYFNNNISNESIQSDIINSQTNYLQYNKWKVYKTMSRLHEQVNIWLLISLASAGLIMLISLTFLAYRFHRNKRVNSHCSKLTKTEQISHLHQFSPTSITYRTASVGSLLSMDDIRYTMISKRLKQNQEQLSSISDDQSHSICDQASISRYKINYSNTTVTPFILVTDSINLPSKSSTGIDQYNLIKTSLPKIDSMHLNVPIKTFEECIPDKCFKDNEYKVVLSVPNNDYLKTQFIHGFIDTLHSGQFSTGSSIETSQIM
ncbi:unnamed protein product [Schistosoma rodhaini]|uniref:LAM_G_DOMAIN domain-containing protein n=1 Tax=Schistosoma rodhaini TaxID=6188 RepID=A0AA85FCN8_9TREM|nr:unnamed protein product [Schistosoma rodhaini]CAH8494577.1 unnamed protein product [Schistosoma rodhaini]